MPRGTGFQPVRGRTNGGPYNAATRGLRLNSAALAGSFCLPFFFALIFIAQRSFQGSLQDTAHPFPAALM